MGDVSDYASLAETRVEGMVTDWWNSSDKQELHYLILSPWPCFWSWGTSAPRRGKIEDLVGGRRSAFLAKGFVGRRRNSVKVDARRRSDVFLYNAIDEIQPFPEKVGWLFYVAARSLFIIVVVNALMTTVLSPGAPQWRLIPAGDKAALRIAQLVAALVVLYGLTAFAYSATRIVQSPFSLTLALTSAYKSSWSRRLSWRS